VLGALFPPNGRYALLVALTASLDLFVWAKDLFVEARPQGGAYRKAAPFSLDPQRTSDSRAGASTYPPTEGGVAGGGLDFRTIQVCPKDRLPLSPAGS
jgi:hypothetical protein